MKSNNEADLRAIMVSDPLPVAFIGSGLASNCPDWKDFLARLVERSGDEELKTLHANAVAANMGLETVLLIAEHALELLPVGELHDCMRATFVMMDVTKIPPIYGTLVRAPFAFYITTNYDTNIEDAYLGFRGVELPVVTATNIGQALGYLRRGEVFVLKIHGCARRGETYVIGHDDYQKVIFGDRHVRYVLGSLLATRSVVFMGYGHRDPHIARYLQYERVILPSGGMRRFTFVTGKVPLFMASILRKMNVSSVELDSWDQMGRILEQATFLRIRDEYSRAKREYARDFRNFVDTGRSESAWGALMYAYSASDLGHFEDVKKLWDTVDANPMLLKQLEANAGLHLMFRVVSGQMWKRQAKASRAEDQYSKAVAIARSNRGVLRPLQALALRYLGIFKLWPTAKSGSSKKNIGEAKALFEEAANVLGEDFPEEQLDIRKWQAVLLGETEGHAAAARKLVAIAAEATKIGYCKNAAWSRYSAADQASRAMDSDDLGFDVEEQLRLSLETFKELEHTRGIGAVHQLIATRVHKRKGALLAGEDVKAIRYHLEIARAMSVVSGDVRLAERCDRLAKDVKH